MNSATPRLGMLHLLLHGDSDSDDEQQQRPSSSPVLYKVGVMPFMVVGVNHSARRVGGTWEKVNLVRSPIPGDSGILVLNPICYPQHIGFVEPRVAVALAPLMDSKLVSTSSVVYSPGCLQGLIGIHCYVHLFCTVESLRTVHDALCRPGFEFLNNHSTEGFIHPMPGFNCPSRVDGVFDRVKQILSTTPAAPPLQPPSDLITEELFPHQKEALGWLVQRENSTDLPPFWFEKDGLYVNELTSVVDSARPEPVRGGIFGDECGSGKRLTLISLIALDKCIRLPWVCDSLSSEDEFFDSCQPWFDHRSNPERMGTDLGLDSSGSGFIRKRATLVICEPAVLSTWTSQIEKYTREGSMSVYMYYGRRTSASSVEVISQFDVVLTTYKTLEAESKPVRRRCGATSSPLSNVRWWRVILDGAETLKRVWAGRTLVITNLRAERRWAVTGCSIDKTQLHSLLSFVRLNPFHMARYWRKLIGNYLRARHPAGVSRLQVVLDSVALIRTKEELNGVGLLPLVFETSFVELSPREREIYDEAEGETKSIVQSFLVNRTLLINYTSVLSLVTRLRQICTDASFNRYDINFFLLPSDIQDVSNRPELLEKLIAVVEQGEDIECPICISPPKDAVITLCAHIFCRGCILKMMKEFKSLCPMCRNHLTEGDLFAPKPDQEERELDLLSSKAKQLIRLLEESKAETPNRKSVVFSQFPNMVASLAQLLQDAGHHVLVLDGSMNRKKREEMVKCYDSVEGPSVLLVSLKTYEAGMELTAASTVYLLEPWWNPITEKQALDRVHRVGQKSPVKVVRLVVKDSIEERVLQLQAMNYNKGLGERGSSYNRNINANAFRLLMGL